MTRIELTAQNLPPHRGLYDGIYLGGEELTQLINNGSHPLMSISGESEISSEMKKALTFIKTSEGYWSTNWSDPVVLIDYFDFLHVKFFSTDVLNTTITKFKPPLIIILKK